MPNWTKEQQEAIDKEGTNIIVSAGAGSGKTAVLSERVLRKIKNGISINELLILTFTNAAASEMKERIRKKLLDDNLLEEANNVDSAYITTFDSYALSIVKKYHYLFNISRNIKIIDSNVINLKKEEIITLLKKHVDPAQASTETKKEAKNRTTKKIKPKPTPTNNPFFPTIFAAISPPIKLPIAADIVTTIEIAVAGTLNLTMAKANRADNPIITKVPINTPKIIARSQTTIDLF